MTNPPLAYREWSGTREGRRLLRLELPSGHRSIRRSGPEDRSEISSSQSWGAFLQDLPRLQGGPGHLGREPLQASCRLGEGTGHVVITAHCENAEAVDAMQQKLLCPRASRDLNGMSPRDHRSVEVDGVNHLCTFAELDRRDESTSCTPPVAMPSREPWRLGPGRGRCHRWNPWCRIWYSTAAGLSVATSKAPSS